MPSLATVSGGEITRLVPTFMLWTAPSLSFMAALKIQGVNKFSLKMRPEELFAELWCVQGDSPLLFPVFPCGELGSGASPQGASVGSSTALVSSGCLRRPDCAPLVSSCVVLRELGSGSPLPPALCSVHSARSELCHACDGASDQPKHAAVQQPGQLAGDPVPGDLLADRPPAPVAAAACVAEEHGVPGAAAAASQRR